MQDAAEQMRSRIAEAIAQRQSGQSSQQQQQPFEPKPYATPPRPINLNLPPWGLPAMAITTIVAGSALMGTNMVLSRDPELEKQRALTESLQRQQETNAVVASEAVRNAGPRFNFCFGLCNDKQRQQQAGPEPTEVAGLPETYATPTPAPSALPTPAPAATQVADPAPPGSETARAGEPAAAPTPAPHSWNQEVYNQWYSYYIAAIPGNWEGYVIRSATVQPHEFDTPEHERAFRDAFKTVEASRTPPPPPQQQPPGDSYQPVSGAGQGGFNYADYQNAGQSAAPYTDSNPYQDPYATQQPGRRPCRRSGRIYYY